MKILEIFSIFLLTIIFIACSKNQDHKQYEWLIDKVDKINIVIPTKNKVIRLNQQETAYLKEILTQNIKIEQPRKLKPSYKLELERDGKKTGTFSIQEDEQESFVNFNSDSLSFGFKLTYGIGRFVNEKN